MKLLEDDVKEHEKQSKKLRSRLDTDMARSRQEQEQLMVSVGCE